MAEPPCWLLQLVAVQECCSVAGTSVEQQLPGWQQPAADPRFSPKMRVGSEKAESEVDELDGPEEVPPPKRIFLTYIKITS